MTLESNKTLGGIGAILMFVGSLVSSYSYGVITLVGLILVMVALYGLANYYRESGIFNNALYGVITAIIGVLLFAVVAVYALFGVFAELGLTISVGTITDWAAALTQMDWANLGFSILGDFLASILLALVVLFVFVVITAIFLRKSLGLLSARTGVGLFGTTGTIILIGAILTIIGIGLILIWIALLLLAIAFFQIRIPQVQSPPQA
ncbi:MAG: DUF996 domain-containing protein [Candidatus Bathyarchaeota archaeon]|nr:DUF996 domain-containing protein [Candidatus Bathyarchaeota archaeon]